MFNDDLLIFIAGMVTAYVFMYFSFLLLRAMQKSGIKQQEAALPAHDPQLAPALAPQVATEDDDAQIALALALAARR